ncbi:hypothetical protein D3C80_1850460 [compost metagenome]
MHKAADKGLKIRCQVRNIIICLLIHMDHLRLSILAAVPVIQHDHIMTGRGTVADDHSDIRVAPFLNHERAAKVAA